MSIKEIAFSVGFQHHSSFVRAFHRVFAQTPIVYRKQQRAPK
jgi:AraC-like DNA-binding protein